MPSVFSFLRVHIEKFRQPLQMTERVKSFLGSSSPLLTNLNKCSVRISAVSYV